MFVKILIEIIEVQVLTSLITTVDTLSCETIYHSLPLCIDHNKAEFQGCGKCQSYVSLCEAFNVTAP